MKADDYRYATLRYSAVLDCMVSLSDDRHTLTAMEAEDFASLNCGRPLEYLAITNGRAGWVSSRLERRDGAEDDTATTKGWYIVGLAAPIEGRAVRFRM